jgi:hypothetical protein
MTIPEAGHEGRVFINEDIIHCNINDVEDIIHRKTNDDQMTNTEHTRN